MSPVMGSHTHFPMDGGSVEHSGPVEACSDPSLGPTVAEARASTEATPPDPLARQHWTPTDDLCDHGMAAHGDNGCIHCDCNVPGFRASTEATPPPDEGEFPDLVFPKPIITDRTRMCPDPSAHIRASIEATERPDLRAALERCVRAMERLDPVEKVFALEQARAALTGATSPSEPQEPSDD